MNVKIVTKRLQFIFGEIKNVQSSESPSEFLRKGQTLSSARLKAGLQKQIVCRLVFCHVGSLINQFIACE